jgi:hypothetical protein
VEEGSSADFVWHFRAFGMSSFGKFVFSGLRSNSGIIHQSDADLYLRGEDGPSVVTDYRCNLVL